MTTFNGNQYGGYTTGYSAAMPPIAPPIGLSMPFMQPPVLHQPVLKQPVMRQSMTMMQQPTHTCTFQFWPAAATDAQMEESKSQQTLPASDPSPKNSTASLNSNEGALPIMEALDAIQDKVFAEPQLNLPELVDPDPTRSSSLDGCTRAVAEPQFDLPEILDTSTTRSSAGAGKVEEVLDGLKDKVDDDCVGVVAQPQFEMLELMDYSKCNSVIDTNGDYRSGMARQAVAYMLKNTMAASKADANKGTTQSDFMHSADISTAASSAASGTTSRAASACPSQRSEKQEERLQSASATPAPAAAVEAVDESQEEPLQSGSATHEAASATGAVGEADTATAVDDQPCSYVSAIICPTAMPPLTFPTSGNHEECTPTVETSPTESTRSDFEARNACHAVETTGAETISNSKDACPKGHDLRWHAWRCATCDKPGHGLRFGCVECHEANLCVACKKTHEAQVGQKSFSSVVREEAKADVAKVSHEMKPTSGMNVIAEGEVAPAPKEGNSRRERPVDSASKSVLSVQPKESSAAAQLLGGLARQPGSKPRSNSRTHAGESKSVVGAARSTQRRSEVGQRGSASVLSVKHTSGSAAAAVLGPLLEQKAK